MAHYIYKTVFGHSIVWQCRFCLSSSHHVVQTGRYLITEIVYKVINYNLKNYIENGGKHGCIATISKKHMTIYSLLGRQMGEHLHFDPVNTRIPNTLMMKMLPDHSYQHPQKQLEDKNSRFCIFCSKSPWSTLEDSFLRTHN